MVFDLLAVELASLSKVTPLLLNDITFFYFKNVNRIYALRGWFLSTTAIHHVSKCVTRQYDQPINAFFVPED